MDYTKSSILFAAIFALFITPVMMEDAFAAERIPGFMKTNIEWYVTGQISEDEFINALTYLMNKDVIVLDQQRADAIKELRDENQRLRDTVTNFQTTSLQSMRGSDDVMAMKDVKIPTRVVTIVDRVTGISSPVAIFVPDGSITPDEVAEKILQHMNTEQVSATVTSYDDADDAAEDSARKISGISVQVGLSTERQTPKTDFGTMLKQGASKGAAALDVGFVRVTDESTNSELLIALPAPDFSGGINDVYFLSALSSLSANDPRAIEGKWSEFVAGVRTGGVPKDINSLIQWALRESYLESNKDLQFYADKVKYYNDQKQALRDHLTELREQRSQLEQFGVSEGDALTGTETSKYTQSKLPLPVGTGEPSPVVSEGLDSLERENESTMTEFSSIQKKYDAAENEVFGIAQQIQENLDLKQQLREDIAELRDIITEDNWPADFTYQDERGKEITVSLTSKKEANVLLDNLEQRLQTLSDTSQMLQLELQDAMNKQQQAMQVLSNIMKNQHDTLKAIIQNMR